jgi:diguanylate cyclase (GGDEF)-like protein
LHHKEIGRQIAAAVPDMSDPSHYAAVTRDRIDMLFGPSALSLLITLLVAAIFVQVQVTQGGRAGAWTWFAGLAVTLLLRALAAWHYRHRRQRLDDRAWLTVHRVGSGLTAAVWGLAGVMFFPAGQPFLQLFTLLVLAGVTAGALSVMTADFVSYRNYVFATLAPVAVLILSRWEQPQLSTGLLTMLMMVFLLRSGSGSATTVSSLLYLRHANAELLHGLEQEKNRLVSEAETMIGTVLSCAPVALWAIDGSGRISFMDGNRLGAQTGLRLPQVGENLLQVFADQPQVVYETERALRGESFVTELMLDGYSFEVHYSPFLDADGERQGAIGVAIDISDRKRQEKELDRRANYDQLTGLPNRSLIISQIEHAFDHARRRRNHVGLFFLDLDNFKSVNDTMGHKTGDRLLQGAAQRLEAALRESDIPARLGGDEFLVVSENLQQPEDAEIVAHKIVDMFKTPFMLDGREIYATTSVGIAIYPQDGETAAALIQSADTAMYHAKSMGKNSYHFYTAQMQQAAEKHLEIETQLRRALERGEMHLMYQPKVDLRQRCIHGAEVLLRWTSPTLGVVPPHEFVPVAEYAGLMPEIGNWVLQQACREAAGWQALRAEPVQIAINVSPQQFRSTDLLANVTEALRASHIPPALLELEITESVLVQDTAETLRIFDELNNLGITLSLDDFGTGYSSLSYLQKFPMRVLKIDRAFIRGLGGPDQQASLVDAIVAMAKSLDMKIVAEGVETAQQLAYLDQRGVDLAQGYLFSRPVDADTFRAMLTGNSTLIGSGRLHTVDPLRNLAGS